MEALLIRMFTALPGPLRRQATPQRLILLAQVTKFAMAGVAGFVVDVATVYALRGALGLYGAGLMSFLTAGTATWALNRAWTFGVAGRSAPLLSQWAAYLGANLAGFVINRGAYAALVAFSPLCASMPALAVAGGSLAGLAANFTLSRRLVFKPQPAEGA